MYIPVTFTACLQEYDAACSSGAAAFSIDAKMSKMMTYNEQPDVRDDHCTWLLHGVIVAVKVHRVVEYI